jgi:RNA polymerase sigma-70 factor (ECF subfamily)
MVAGNAVAGALPASSGDASGGAPPQLSPLREMQLVEAFRQGDQEAAGELLRAYQRRIHAVCFRMLRDREEAIDLTQDAMIRVLEGLKGYDGRSRLSTWVIRVTMNVCLSHLRRERLRRHRSLDDPDPLSGLPRSQRLPAEPSPGRGVQHGEMAAHLERALDAIDPQMRAVLVLRDLHDLNYQQIAEVLDLPVGTVKSRLFRARVGVRTFLETRGYGP